MRLSVLLTAGSCGILLVACSRKPKPPGEVARANDAPVVTALSGLPGGTPLISAPEKVTVAGGATASPAVGGGSPIVAVAPTTDAAMPAAASAEHAQEPLAPVNPSADSAIWLGAIAPAGAPHDALFTRVTPVVDTTRGGSIGFSTRAVGIGASVIGLGALMDAGGAWGGSSSNSSNSTGDPGLGQVFVEALGLAFNGYRSGGSLFGFTWSAPASAYFAPVSWSSLDSYFGGGNSGWGSAGWANPSYGGGGSSHGGGSDDYNPPKNNNDRGWDGSHQTPPVTATPEPGSIVLLATGLLALVPVVRRRRRTE